MQLIGLQQQLLSLKKSTSQITLHNLQPKGRKQTQIVCSTTTQKVQVTVKNFEGKANTNKDLEFKIAEDTARGLIHRAVVYERRLKRRGTASTLTRAEVSGGGKKPYQQKGTGNARRGSSRSPLLKGGGVIFGPKPRDWKIDINRKELQLAIGTALQDAAQHNDLNFIEDLNDNFSDRKTKSVIAALTRWGIQKDEKVLIILNQENLNLFQAGRNIQNLNILIAKKLNVYDILNADKILVEESAHIPISIMFGQLT